MKRVYDLEAQPAGCRERGAAAAGLVGPAPDAERASALMGWSLKRADEQAALTFLTA